MIHSSSLRLISHNLLKHKSHCLTYEGEKVTLEGKRKVEILFTFLTQWIIYTIKINCAKKKKPWTIFELSKNTVFWNRREVTEMHSSGGSYEGKYTFRVLWLTLSSLFQVLSTCYPVPGESSTSSPLLLCPYWCGVHKAVIDTQAR